MGRMETPVQALLMGQHPVSLEPRGQAVKMAGKLKASSGLGLSDQGVAKGVASVLSHS